MVMDWDILLALDSLSFGRDIEDTDTGRLSARAALGPNFCNSRILVILTSRGSCQGHYYEFTGSYFSLLSRTVSWSRQVDYCSILNTDIRSNGKLTPSMAMPAFSGVCAQSRALWTQSSLIQPPIVLF